MVADRGYRQFYDEIYKDLSESESYLKPGPNWYTFLTRFRAISGEISSENPRDLLDIGCGDGLYCILATRRGIAYYGIDIALANLERLKKWTKQEGLSALVNTVLCDASRLPFRHNSFEAGLCSEVLEHVLDMDTVIDEISRSVQRTIIISTPCIGSLLFDFVLDRFADKRSTMYSEQMRAQGTCTVLSKLLREKGSAHVRYLTMNRLLGVLGKHSLTAIRVLGAGFDMPLLTNKNRYKHPLIARLLIRLEERWVKHLLLFDVPKLHIGHEHIVVVARHSS